MPHNVNDQVAIVTGGAAGIGQGIAIALAAAGAKVAIWDVNEAASEQTVQQITADGGVVEAFCVDVTDSAAIARAVAGTIAKLGEPQILVNNAGFSRNDNFLEIPESNWDLVLNVCLKSVFLVSQAVAARMVPLAYGRIVNIASRGTIGVARQANYSAAKAGVLGLTGAMSMELAPQGITVNAVSPGLIRTERVKNLATFPETERRAKETTPVKRPGEPKDIAGCVLYLASRDAGFITGENIRVTGGQ